MNFFTAETICRLLAPRHELSCSWFLSRRLIKKLRPQGLNGRRESGAFLLGKRNKARARISSFLLYNDVDPKCLDSAIIRLDGRHFGGLWDHCERHGLEVVADVHTHPGGSAQSDSDRAHPIVARSGHIALILPNYAIPAPYRFEIGIYRYQGQGMWESIPTHGRKRFFYIGV